MSQEITAIKSLLEKAEESLVLLPQNPGPDSIASALSLAIALENNGKKAYIACGTPLDFSQYPLKQSDRITQKIGNKNLVVSLKIDNRDSVDKVSYNLDESEKIFNLVITPKKGANPLQSNAVSFSLAGARADIIFTVGASGFDDLGSIYAAEPSLFTETPTVAINRLKPASFATYHCNKPEASSLAEYTTQLITDLGLAMVPDVATNLLAAIDVVTDKLQLQTVTAITFETVAKLIRAGGTRIMLSLPNQEENVPTATAVEMTSANETQTLEPQQQEIPQEWLEPKILKATKAPVAQSNG